jgi:Uma2 family endonuclease
MSAQPKTRMTVEEYLAFERASETKHEFWGGLVYSMAGASRRHVAITGSTFASLYTQLRKRPCQVYSNDMRVRIGRSDDFAYPDIVLTCDAPRFDDSDLDTLLNPKVIIEVLSESTERHDRGGKFAGYRAIASLQDYILVNQNRPMVEHFARKGDQWILSIHSTLDAVIHLPSIDCTLQLIEMYEKADFEPPVDDGLGEVRDLHP